MNRYAKSAECIHGLCSHCHYENCACECHDEERGYPQDAEPDDYEISGTS